MGRYRAIAHNIRKEEQRIILFRYILDFTPYHGHPFVKYLFEIVRRDLGADNIALGYGVFDGMDKLLFVGFYLEADKISPDIGRDFI